MKINPIRYNTQAFGKAYLGKTDVQKKDHAKDTVDFVEYHPTNYKDRTQLYALAEDWKLLAPWIDNIISRVKMLNTSASDNSAVSMNFHFYGLEDKNGKTLAIAETTEPDFIPGEVKLAFIQTNPFQSYTAKNRTYFGLGESLMAKIIEKAQEDGKERIVLHSTNKPFWDNSSLFETLPDITKDMRCIRKSSFQNYINFVEEKKNNT